MTWLATTKTTACHDEVSHKITTSVKILKPTRMPK